MTTRMTLVHIAAGLLVALAACGPERVGASTVPEHDPMAITRSSEASLQDDAMREAASLTPARRAAFMSGHVAAGLALYRAGAPNEAAPHLLHPVSEMHASEREGLAALGFDPALFEAVAAAVELGEPAAAVEPLLANAEDNLRAVRAAAGGDPADLIGFLVKTCAYEYNAGVDDGVIVNVGEYQDAFGFAVTARDIAAGLTGEGAAGLLLELELLVRMWPSDGPLAMSVPAPETALAGQISQVDLALAVLPESSVDETDGLQ